MTSSWPDPVAASDTRVEAGLKAEGRRIVTRALLAAGALALLVVLLVAIGGTP